MITQYCVGAPMEFLCGAYTSWVIFVYHRLCDAPADAVLARLVVVTSRVDLLLSAHCNDPGRRHFDQLRSSQVSILCAPRRSMILQVFTSLSSVEFLLSIFWAHVIFSGLIARECHLCTKWDICWCSWSLPIYLPIPRWWCQVFICLWFLWVVILASLTAGSAEFFKADHRS